MLTQNRLSKIAQDARSGAREGIGTARGAQIASCAKIEGSASSRMFRHRADTPSDTPDWPRPATGEIPTRRLRFPQISTGFSLHNVYYTKWSKACSLFHSHTSPGATTWHRAQSGKAASASAW